jgi:pilus assembly protein CpaC
VPLVEARPIIGTGSNRRSADLPPIVTPQTLQRPAGKSTATSKPSAPAQAIAPVQTDAAVQPATALAPVVSAAEARKRKGAEPPKAIDSPARAVQHVMTEQEAAVERIMIQPSRAVEVPSRVLNAQYSVPNTPYSAPAAQQVVPAMVVVSPKGTGIESVQFPRTQYPVLNTKNVAPPRQPLVASPTLPVPSSSSATNPPNALRAPAVIDNPLVLRRETQLKNVENPRESVVEQAAQLQPKVLSTEYSVPGTQQGPTTAALDSPTPSLKEKPTSEDKPAAATEPKELSIEFPVLGSQQPAQIAKPAVQAIARPGPITADSQQAAAKSKVPASSVVQTANLLQPQPEPAAPPLEPAAEPQPLLPEGSPFEAIGESGTIHLRVRKSLLMRTKVDVYRTATVDEGIVELVQFTPREISLIGRSQGQTHITFWFDDPAQAPVTYVVEVAPDPQAITVQEEKYKLLENVINEMFPDSKVYLVLVADKLLVKGQARDSEEAAQIMTIIRAQAGGIRNGVGGLTEGAATPVLSMEAAGGNLGPAYTIINMLRVPGVQQVALKVKIAELNRSAARGFGVDIAGAIDIGSSSELIVASVLNAIGGGGTSLIASLDGGDINIGLRYLQERGVIRLLSEPTLVTLSGRPATFIAGGEFAVPTVVGSVGLNAVTTDFRAFGAIISFVPTVVDKDRIRLQVAPEFSQINSDLAVGGTPGLNVRAATTTVEMREGQTLAIAGLLEDNYNATSVGDLPFLAQIFGRRDTSRNETELIILVTPELVQPMEPEEVPPLPGFDVTEPTAGEFFLGGHIEGNPTRDHRSTVWPRLRRRYGMGGPAMTSGPFGHGQ